MPLVSVRASARPFFRLIRAGATLVALAALSACAGSSLPDAAEERSGPVLAALEAAPPAEIASDYQRLLDRHAIPLDIPQRGKAILVNIPSYELIAFEDGEPVMRSRVVVGRPRDGDQTPWMDSRTSVVRFRPTWRPTPMMIERDGYEDRVWPAGAGNPLGLLAIRLHPGSLIYLHGTNRPELFERDRRALSGGCVRVERWDEVAAWVLGIPLEAVREAAAAGPTFDMGTTGVPVLMRYFTRFPDADGAIRRHDDVYGILGPAPAETLSVEAPAPPRAIAAAGPAAPAPVLAAKRP